MLTAVPLQIKSCRIHSSWVDEFMDVFPEP